jgi:hypothetical protein
MARSLICLLIGHRYKFWSSGPMLMQECKRCGALYRLH